MPLFPLVRCRVSIFTVDEGDYVCILFNASRLTKIRQLRMVIRALLNRPGQLGNRDDRDIQITRYRFLLSGNLTQFLHAILSPILAACDELQVVDDHEVNTSVGMQSPYLATHLQHRLCGRIIHVYR